MIANGWLQIVLFSALVIAITKPFGGYMTRVFAGEQTLLSPVLRPVERFVYWCCGVDETADQSWRSYAVAMMLSERRRLRQGSMLLQRLHWYLPFNPQGQPGVEQILAFNTSVSFVTNTNWQSYVPENTMGYLVQMAGLTVHNFVPPRSASLWRSLLIRGFVTARGKRHPNFLVVSLVARFTSCCRFL